MPKLAVDVNVVLTWLGFQSELLKAKATLIFGELVRGNLEVMAPDFLLVELVNVLKWRLKRTERESREFIKKVIGSGIKFVSIEVNNMREMNKLVYKYGLTAYDALYLLVAQRAECKLVTADPKLLEVKDWCVGLETVEI